MAQQGKTSRKAGRQLRSAAHGRYNSMGMWLKHKITHIKRACRFHPEQADALIAAARIKFAAFTPKKAQ